jgi:hypothetical protein
MDTSHALVALVAVAVLAAVHIYAGYLDRWHGYGRELFFSAAAGISVSYVVMQLLPELSRSDATLTPIAQRFLPQLDRHGYFLAVIGIIVFYANATSIARSRAKLATVAVPAPAADSGIGNDADQTAEERSNKVDRRAFITSIVLTAIFNVTVAYSLADPKDRDVQPILLFTIALALHYFVADEALHSNYQDYYHRYGRWILVGALATGWLVGSLYEVSAAILALIIAFFAGGILATDLGNELKASNGNRVWAFAIGAVGFSIMLMFVQSS